MDWLVSGISILYYVIGAVSLEIAAYSLLTGLCADITIKNYGSLSSISDGLALSPGITSYYIFIIYVFTVGRNAYEFWIDPYDRLTAWNTNIGLYVAIWLRILFLNIMMLFLMLLGSMPNTRDSQLHNSFAITAVIFHLIYEFTCIGIRSYYASIKNLRIMKSLNLYIFLLCIEALMVVFAILYALCFINVFEFCPSGSLIGFISEYLLMATIVTTPVFRILD